MLSRRETRSVLDAFNQADRMAKWTRQPAIFDAMDRMSRIAAAGSLSNATTMAALGFKDPLSSKVYRDAIGDQTCGITDLVKGSQSVIKTNQRMGSLLAEATKSPDLLGSAKSAALSGMLKMDLDPFNKTGTRLADHSALSKQVMGELSLTKAVLGESALSSAARNVTAPISKALGAQMLADRETSGALRALMVGDRLPSLSRLNIFPAESALTRSMRAHEEQMRRLMGIGTLAAEIAKLGAGNYGPRLSELLYKEDALSSLFRDRLHTLGPAEHVDEDVFAHEHLVTDEDIRDALWIPARPDADEHLVDRLGDGIERQLWLLAPHVPFPSEEYIGALVQISTEGRYRVARNICYTMTEYTRTVLTSLTRGQNKEAFAAWIAANGERLGLIERKRGTPTAAARWYFVALGQYTQEDLDPNAAAAAHQIAEYASRLESIKHGASYYPGEVPVLVAAVVRNLIAIFDARFIRRL